MEIKFNSFDHPGTGNPASAEFTLNGGDAGYIEQEITECGLGLAKEYKVIGYTVFFWSEDLPAADLRSFSSLKEARAWVRAVLKSNP